MFVFTPIRACILTLPFLLPLLPARGMAEESGNGTVPEIQAPSFSHPPGFYAEDFFLNLETSHNGLYSYSVQKEGYQAVHGEVQVVDQDVTVFITLLPGGQSSPPPVAADKSFQVTFRVDVSESPFEPGDVIYISGTMSDPVWPEPGSDPAMALEPVAGEEDIHGITFSLEPGHYAYKYFLNQGWGGGEWGGDPNREVEVYGNEVFHDVWGVIDPDDDESHDPEAPGTHTVTFVVQDPDGNSLSDAVIAFDGTTYPAGHYHIQDVLPAAVVRYTTDGSIPNAGSPLYTGPVHITDRSGEPNGISMIPTNNIPPGHVYDEHWQPPAGEIFKISSIRARAFLPNGRGGKVATRSYIVHEEAHQRYSMPLISINAHAGAFFQPDSGIYVYGNHANYFQRGEEWERLVHFEFFEKDGNPSFAQNMGARIHGGTSRNRPRKSLRMYARSDYGTTWVDYPLFPQKEIHSYKRFLLRNSGNDWGDAIFRDAFMQSLLKDLDLDIQYSRPAVVFINGEYWGIHNIRDRLDNRYLQTHYGIEDEMSYTILERNAEFDRGNPAGTDHYLDLLSFLDSPGVEVQTDYEEVKTRMDVYNFTDYQLSQIYMMNTDWPGNNIQYWRYHRDTFEPDAPPGLDGRWRWQVFDLDFGFGLNFDYVTGVEEGPAHNTLAFALEDSGPAWPNPPWSTFILRRLLENEDYKHHFVSRFADLLNTIFEEGNVLDQLEAYRATYLPEMPEHIHRWRMPDGMDHWESEIDVMRSFAEQRPGYLRQYLAQEFALGPVSPLHVQVINPGQGSVRVNTISVGGGTEPWTGLYFQGMPVYLEALPATGQVFSHWEGLPDSGNPSQSLVLEGESTVTAHFQDGLIHYWHFNNLPDGTLHIIEPDYSMEDGAAITYPGSGAGVMDRSDGTRLNAAQGASAGYGLRTRNPSHTRHLVIHAPSTGYKDLLLSFAVHRTSNGATQQQAYYSADAGQEWIPLGAAYGVGEQYQRLSFELSDIPEVNDNPDLRFRIAFLGDEAQGAEGNNRFDNITLSGESLWLRLGKTSPPTAYLGEAYEGHYFKSSGGTPPYEFSLSQGSLPSGMQLASNGKLFGTPEQAGSFTFSIVAVDATGSQQSREYELEVQPHVLIHYWHFNDLPGGTLYNIPADHSLTANQAGISYPGSGDGYLDRGDGTSLGVQQNEAAAYALRVRNPADSRQLLLSLPSQGFEDLRLSYAVQRTANGAQEHELHYSPDGGISWHDLGSIQHAGLSYSYKVVSLAGLEGTANNPQLKVRMSFTGPEASGDSGNNRFDNIALHGTRSNVSLPETGSRGGYLEQNYPNPFSRATTIPFSLDHDQRVRINIYNIQGVLVRTILDQNLPAGRHEVLFETRGLPPGLYVYRLMGNARVESKPMILSR